MAEGATRGADPDAVILRIARRQQGVVSRSQLLRAGVRAHAIDFRRRKGLLRALHRGVYACGPVASRLQREAAALLACGSRAVLSHFTASTLWGLTPHRGAPVDITSPRSLRGPGRGVRLHRIDLLPDEVDRKHGLPVTTPARTLLDLASCADGREIERALARAERRQLVTADAVAEMLARHPSRRGSRILRICLDNGPSRTRSEAEGEFLKLVSQGAIPDPDINVILEGFEVDFLWREERLIVEIDGFAYHGDRAAFERDRHRDASLIAAGFRVLRLTWRQLTAQPGAVLVRVAQALALGSRERRSR